MTGRLARLVLGVLLLIAATQALAAPSARDLPPGLHVPAGAAPGPDFDVDRATEAWLGLLTPTQRALSDAYFEGKYWLSLWTTLYGIGVMTLLLRSGLSVKLRDAAERLTRRRFPSVLAFGAMFVVVVFLLDLPLVIYAGFVREHQYGLSNLTFAGWLRERLIQLAVTVVIGALLIAIAYAGLRRSGARWWVWGTALSFAFSLFLSFVHPLFIAPLFNHYQPLPEGPVREAVLKLARANEIPTQHLEWFDASRQTTRVSANVSGIAGVARINLNDNLLERTSLPEIKAVLGHEMGHYVLNHAWQLTIYLTVVTGVILFIVALLLERALARWGPRLRLSGRGDPAALPLIIALFSAVSFVFTPISNTIVRTAETEADAFGLNAAREPQGFAMVSMRLSTYRKLRPGPLEEVLFYDHPSGYDRVHRSMTWMKENMPQ